MTALQGIDLEVSSKERVAILGPNGSGKSTLLKLIAGLLRPTKGSVEVLAKNPRLSRSLIGYTGHEHYLYPYLTAKENLSLYSRLYGLSGDVSGALQQIGLSQKADQLCSTLSRGQLQRLSLARALVHSPSLLLLDEPFAGVDRASRQSIEERLEDATVVMVTHDKQEALRLCNRIVSLAEGRIVEDA